MNSNVNFRSLTHYTSTDKGLHSSVVYWHHGDLVVTGKPVGEIIPLGVFAYSADVTEQEWHGAMVEK